MRPIRYDDPEFQAEVDHMALSWRVSKRIGSRLCGLAVALLVVQAGAAGAQGDLAAARRRLLCASLGVDFTDPLSQIMFQRCLQQGPRAMIPGRPAGPVPQLVRPVGPLVTPAGALIAPPNSPGPSRGDGCRQGFVWREATRGDHVCVDPETRQEARLDNDAAAARVNPVDHSYGPDTCRGGFVWRETIPSDHVCVLPVVRAQARADNAAAAGRVAR